MLISLGTKIFSIRDKRYRHKMKEESFRLYFELEITYEFMT